MAARQVQGLQHLEVKLIGFIGSSAENFSRIDDSGQNTLTRRFKRNSFEGSIPASFSKLTSLPDLFVGSSSLTGNLPHVKSTTLCNIDLSYNELSETLPSLVN